MTPWLVINLISPLDEHQSAGSSVCCKPALCSSCGPLLLLDYLPDPESLLLAKKIEVGMAAGARVDDGGKIFGEIVRIARVVPVESKRELERRLRGPG
jgi:hypothetical protein